MKLCYITQNISPSFTLGTLTYLCNSDQNTFSRKLYCPCQTEIVVVWMQEIFGKSEIVCVCVCVNLNIKNGRKYYPNTVI